MTDMERRCCQRIRAEKLRLRLYSSYLLNKRPLHLRAIDFSYKGAGLWLTMPCLKEGDWVYVGEAFFAGELDRNVLIPRVPAVVRACMPCEQETRIALEFDTSGLLAGYNYSRLRGLEEIVLRKSIRSTGK